MNFADILLIAGIAGLLTAALHYLNSVKWRKW